MIYRSEESRHPSLLVEDGETAVVSAHADRALGLSVLKLRPRTTAALLTLAGMAPRTGPRLGDRAAFEEIGNSDGLMNFAELDADRRLDGYTVPFLRGVLEAMDPNERSPPSTVKRLAPISEEDSDCGCSGRRFSTSRARVGFDAAALTGVAKEDASQNARMRAVQSYVPDFLVGLRVFGLVVAFGDIVVGRNATLVLDSDVFLAVADNVLGYRGSRIVQRAPYLNMDVSGRLRGSILDVVHSVTDVLKVNWTALATQAPTKP
jgi:hypothetical protein